MERIAIDAGDAGDAVYTIGIAGNAPSATRAKKVRDVVIGTASLSAEAWLAEVRAHVGALAERSADASDSLREFR